MRTLRPFGDGASTAYCADAKRVNRWRRSDVAVVCELERDAEVALLEQADDFLEIVAALAGDADLILLDAGLDLQLGVLDEPHDLAGLFDGNALLQTDALALETTGGVLHLAVGEGLERHAAPMQPPLEDVHHGLELHLVGGGDHDVGLVQGDLFPAVLEIVAGVDLPPGLIDRVGDLLGVDLADDVERVFSGHRRAPLTEGDGGGPGWRDEGEQAVAEAGVDGDLAELHRHRVLELVIDDGLSNRPLARLEAEDPAR